MRIYHKRFLVRARGSGLQMGDSHFRTTTSKLTLASYTTIIRVTACAILRVTPPSRGS